MAQRRQLINRPPEIKDPKPLPEDLPVPEGWRGNAQEAIRRGMVFLGFDDPKPGDFGDFLVSVASMFPPIAGGKQVFKNAQGRLVRRQVGDQTTTQAVEKLGALKRTDEQFDKAHEAAYAGNPLTAKKSVRMRRQEDLNKAYDEHVRTRGGEPDHKPVERPAPTKQQPTPYISDEQAREWSTKLLQTMTKYGYKPDGSELASMLDLARAMKPRGNLRNITPSEFAQAYQRTLPQMLRGNQVGSRGNPAYQVFKKDGFFKDFNTAAGQPTTLGNWGHVGKSRPRGTAKPSRREPDPPKNLDSDPEFTPVGEELPFVPGQSLPKPDGEAAYERLRRQGGRTPSPSNPGDSLMRQHLIKPDEPKASRYLGGDNPRTLIDNITREYDEQLIADGLSLDGYPQRLENPLSGGTAKIPPAAARERAELMIGLLNDDDFHESALKAALQDILATHPRTLGHVEKMRFGDDAIPHLTHSGRQDRGNQSAVAGDILMNPPDIPQPYYSADIDDHLSVINIGEPRASERMMRMQNAGQDVRDPLNDFEAARDMNRELLAHELTHVGQQLRHGYDFEKYYMDAMNKGSYADNPFEISARLSESGAGARPGQRPQRRNLSYRMAPQHRGTNEQGVMQFHEPGRPKPSRSPDDNYQGNIPAFRSKSGMAVDVLDEMKAAPRSLNQAEIEQAFRRAVPDKELKVMKIDGADASWERPLATDPTSELEKFADMRMRQHGGMQPNVASSYENTFQALDDLSVPPEKAAGLFDPAAFVGNMRGWDEAFLAGRGPDALEKGNIDVLIQDLANYFTGPKFDPFAGEPRKLLSNSPDLDGYKRYLKWLDETGK